MPDFWRNSGFHLLERDRAGRLAVTDDFLRAYLLRPEIRPVDESGPAECRLHESLLDDPRRPVSVRELDAVEDPDARLNYRLLLDYFSRLLAAPSIEACYSALFSGSRVTIPPLFIDQLAQVILRNVLEGVEDPIEARAGELFYREQKASVEGGTIVLADLETVEMHASGSAYGSLGRLIVEAQAPIRNTNLDVIDERNAAAYWSRDQRHDYVINLNYGRAGLNALARVLERWIRHFFPLDLAIEPLREIREERWAWHVGLDAQSTAVLNDLWQGTEVEPGRLRQLLALFRLDFAETAVIRPDVAGRPVYLALGMDEQNVVRLKPQNLLTNLPLAATS
ncbi:MAG: DUF6352 family protein [Betaproteobacteria bacterium]|nr:DUF6352 family protein [Betaproteobacteria bacterium]